MKNVKLLSDRKCLYRHCGRVFEDKTPRGTQRYCCEEHRRREKLFRSGKAQDLSYFRKPDPVLEADAGEPARVRTCRVCKVEFELEPSEGNNNRCPSCRDEARNKTCRKCGSEYRDESKKNTRRYCDECSSTKSSERASVSSRTATRRRSRVRRGEGGRVDQFETLVPYTNTWWGRVGEVLYGALYPQAQDAVAVYGNRVPFDFEHREEGRVNVKIAKDSGTERGQPSWTFQIEGLQDNCDLGFLIGLDRPQKNVERAWRVPVDRLPRKGKTMTPGSREYEHAPFEVSKGAVEVMNRHLHAILEEGRPAQKRGRPERPEYERTLLGKVGEAIYRSLHLTSEHVAADNPTAPYDFKDENGVTVNVRVRRPSAGKRRRWQFIRGKDCKAEEYYFIGMDEEASRVEVVLRVPESELPSRGFSLNCNLKRSKWLRYREDLDLPRSVSDFVGVRDFDAVHLAVSASLSKEEVESLTPLRREALLNQAFLYHRALGFPYPSIPSDKRVLSNLSRIARYVPEGDNLPPENGGLGFCSAYMPHRFASRNVNADFSALGAFQNDDRLRRALSFCLRGSDPSLRRRPLRSALTALNRTPTQFRPAISAFLCGEYCVEGGLVFDPCAGWGGRLTGALAKGRRYFGVDLSKKTCDSLYLIGSRLCELLDRDRHSSFRLENSDFRGVEVEEGSADFALTSPPYWSQEEYEGAGSSLTYDRWLNVFMRPLVGKVYKALRPGSHFALNVADIRQGGKEYLLVRDALEIAKDCGFMLTKVWRMQKSSFGGRAPGSEDIMVFRKAL